VDEAEVFIVAGIIEPFAKGFGVELERFDAGGFVAGLGGRALLVGSAALAFEAAAFGDSEMSSLSSACLASRKTE
jgi:hypothetical protein